MILAVEIGLTIMGLMAIVRQKWSVGNYRFVTGVRAIFLGGLSLLTIPIVYSITALVHVPEMNSAQDMVQGILTFRLQGDNLNGLLIELIVVLLWATIILGISGWFNWTNRAIKIEKPTEASIDTVQS